MKTNHVLFVLDGSLEGCVLAPLNEGEDRGESVDCVTVPVHHHVGESHVVIRRHLAFRHTRVDVRLHKEQKIVWKELFIVCLKKTYKFYDWFEYLSILWNIKTKDRQTAKNVQIL